MNKDAKIFVAGGTGLVGSAIIKRLLHAGFKNIITSYYSRKPSINSPAVRFIKINLLKEADVADFFCNEKPEFVFLAAARVGGIIANNIYRAQFIYENLRIQNNIIHQSFLNNIKKLLFLGSTCIYPGDCPQPIKEDYLLTSPLEYTNEPYAIAKIAGIKMCESYNIQYGTNFLCVMPTNLYGPNDNFDLETSHVLPAILRKTHLAKALTENNWDVIRKDLNKRPVKNISGNSNESEILKILEEFGIRKRNNEAVVEIWGTGKPLREFLWSEDMADACVFIMENIDFKDILKYKELKSEIRNTHINIGTGKDISIKDLSEKIKNIVGFTGDFYFNTSKPDGTLRKVTDVSLLKKLGWQYKMSLSDGIENIYRWYIKYDD